MYRLVVSLALATPVAGTGVYRRSGLRPRELINL